MQKPGFFDRIGRWINKTVQRRLIIWTAGFWIIAIIILVLVFLLIGQNQMLTVARQRNVQLASTISRDVNFQLNNITENTRTFVQRLEVLKTDLHTQADALLGLRLSSPRYRAIYYYDSNETLLIHLTDTAQSLLSVKNLEEIIDRPSIAVRDEIKNVYMAVKETGIHISDFYYTPLDFIPVLYIGMPVAFSTGEKRVAVFEVDLTDIWQKIEIATVGQTGFAYIVSREGVIIAHPEPSYIGHQIPPEIKPVLEDFEGSTQFVDPFTGHEIVAAYSPVGGLLGWGIVVSQDRGEIYAAIVKSGTIIVVILLTIGLIGTAGILFLIMSVTRPIKELTKTTQSIARTGNLVKTGTIQRSDEVGQLSQAFDQMIDKVKDTEDKLTSSEERYRSLFEHANDAIFLISEDKIIDCNHKTEEIFGASRDQIINKSPSDLSPDNQPDGTDSREKAQEMINRAYMGEVQLFEWRHRKLNGELFDAEVCLNRLNIDNKQILMVIIRDITERKRTAEKLQESEQLFRSIVENSQAGIFTVDNAFRFTYINDRLCRILGYSKDEIIGHDFREFLDDESKKLVVERYVKRQQGLDVPPWYEFVIIQKSGVLKNVELSAAVVRDSRGNPSTLGQILDITERKKAQIELQQAHDELEDRVEKRTADLKQTNVLLQREISQRKETEEKLRESESKYRDLVESANSIILEFNLYGNITFINRFAQEFFGYREEEILGRNIMGTIVPQVDSTGDDLIMKMDDLIQHPERYYSSENENMRRNGERVWVAWTNRGIYDEQGNLRNILSIGIDRTEQKKTTEMLAKQERENIAAAERNRLARDLHDAVSQTLFAASVIAEVLPRLWEKDPDAGRESLKDIRELTRGALAEMRTLLFELRPSALADADLGDLLRQLADSITSRARVSVSTQIEGQCSLLPETKIGFYRITQEALNNIAKHSGASKATVSLNCQPGKVELCIKDNGKGFNSSAVTPESLGLGIMRERAAAIGASLNIRSKINEGTEITAVWREKQKEELK